MNHSEVRKLLRSGKNKPLLHHLYVSLFVILLVTRPVAILNHDTFCTETWTDIQINDLFTGALRANGSLFTWGNNAFGVLGYGDHNTIQKTPFLVGNATDTWKMIATGFYFTLGLKIDGSVFGWGRNLQGTLGSGAANPQFTPIHITGLGNCTYIAVLGPISTAFAVKTDGTLWGLGDNEFSQLGVSQNTTSNSSIPIQIGNDSDWASIFPGQYDSQVCGFKINGSLFCWGRNNAYQVGDGTTTTRADPFMIGSSNDTWVSIHPTSIATIALSINGSLYGWGLNGYGILAQDSFSKNLTTPTQIATNLTFTQVAVSYSYVIGLASDGTIWGWGRNNYTQVNSNSSVIHQMTPNQISTDTDWKSVYVTFDFNNLGGSGFGIKNNGRLYGWGRNGDGQLGIQVNQGRVGTPTQIPLPGKTFTKVSAAVYFTGAIDTEGQIFTTGTTAFGSLGFESFTSTNLLVSCENQTLTCSDHICLNVSSSCDPPCTTCDSANTSSCLSCSSPDLYNPLNHTCGDSCPNGYFGDEDLHKCRQCHSSCTSCNGTSNTHCLSCTLPNYLASNNSCGISCLGGTFGDNSTATCVNSCPDGFYGDNSTHQCLQCDTSCKACNGGSNINCTSCNSPNYLFSNNHSCVNPCPGGYHGDNTTQTCLSDCDMTCATCNSSTPNVCTSCSGAYPVHVGTGCYAQCLDGHYIRNRFICTDCDISCNGCYRAKVNCLQCATGYVRNSSSGLCVGNRLLLLRSLEVEKSCDGLSC